MSVISQFRKKDWIVIGGLAAAVLAGAGIAHMFSLFQRYGPQVEIVTNALLFITGLITVYFLYKSVQKFGGEVGRGLSLIGIAYGYMGITAVAHIYFHVEHPMFLPFYTFQHTMQAWAFLLVVYGFYLLYRGGTE